MKNLKNKISSSPYLLLIFGFMTTILLGALLLMLPMSSSNNTATPFLTALFTSTSATCVTGLVVVDTGTYFSTFGQIIIMLLIQIGGVGIMGFAAICIQLFRGKLSIKNKLNLQEAYNSNLNNGFSIVKVIFTISIIAESIGAFFLSFVFIPELGLPKGAFYSIFHSISAFNNAGFDLNGNFSSLTNYTGNFIINITIMLLIVTGSLGFLAILDIHQKRNFKRFSLTTKIVIKTTFFLILIGFLSFFIFEFNNPETIGNLSLSDKILASLFLSITPRTAGFNTINMSSLTIASSLVTIILMYIGASPTSTGGGLKTTTIMIPILSVIAIFKGKEDIEIYERKIPKNLVAKAIAIICIVFTLSIVAIIILSFTEQCDFMTILFEVSSAINTVGLSFGLTPSLSIIGQIIIILLMFIGRTGPLTLVLALVLKKKQDSSLRYLEEKIMIG